MNKYSSDEDIHSWLSLVTQHGLFVSDPVLNTAFSKGVERISPESFRAFKREFDLHSIYSEKDDVAKFTKWINFILEDFLGFSRSSWCKHPNISDDVKHYLFEYDQWLAPDRVLLSNDGKPLLLVKIVKNGKSLEKPEKERGKWKASPYFKLTTLCLEKNIPLALLTNGNEFRLIHVKPTTGTSYFEWKAIDFYEEKSLLDSFYTFLNKDRFFGDEDKRLSHLIDESQKRQLDVTDQLGKQMHHALEIFVRAIGNLKQSDLQDLFSKATGEYIYEMSLTFMMRLVFLLYAEENGLLPHGNFVYENNYGISHLVYQIQSRSNNEDYMNKKDAWPRILALFRLIYNGCGHPDVKSIPYDSKLFDPKRFPELEHPSLVLDNKTIWNFLHNLCYAETKIGREKVKQKVSYHTIDVEQIGSVYESLIGFSVERASEKMVVFSGKEKTIRPVSEFINLDEDALVDYLKSVTARTESSISKILEENDESDEGLARFEKLITEEGTIEKDQLYISRAGSIRKSSGTYYTPKEISRFLVQEALEPIVYEETDKGNVIKSPSEILDLNVCDPAMGSGAFLVQAIRYLSERLVESWTKINSETDENITLPYGDISHGADTEELLPSDETEALQRAKLYVAQNCIYGVDKNPMAVELAKVSIWLTTMCKDRPLTFLDHRLKCGDSLIGTDFEHISKIPDEPLWKEDKKYNREAIKSKTLAGINFEDYIKDILILHDNLKNPELTIEDIKRKSKQYKEAHTKDKPINKLKEVFDLWTCVWFWPYDEKEKKGIKEDTKKTNNTTLFTINNKNQWINNKEKLTTNKINKENNLFLDNLPPPHTGSFRDIVLRILGINDSHIKLNNIEKYEEIFNESNKENNFFHWQLEYPEIFLDKNGKLKEKPGFDAIVGNPPWDMLKENSDEFFSRLDTNFRSYDNKIKKQKMREYLSNQEINTKWEKERRKFQQWTNFFKKSKIFPNIGSGHINAFKLFLEKDYNLVKKNGFVNLVVPSGIYTDEGCTDLRKMILSKSTLRFIICFENRNGIFPIHRMFKFVVLSITKDDSELPIKCAFMIRDVSFLLDWKKNTIEINKELISRFSPETLSIVEFNSNDDIEIIKKIYSNYPFLSDNVKNSWNVCFKRMFNITDDRPLFNTDSIGFPLYEGKMFFQYISDYEKPKYWVSESNGRKFLLDKYKIKSNKKENLHLDCDDFRVCFRDISSSTNERTMVSTILPIQSFSSDTTRYTSSTELIQKNDELKLNILISPEECLFLCSLFNSFCIDFVLRKKVTSHVSIFIVHQLSMPRLTKGNWFFDQLVPRTARLICIDEKYSKLWESTYNNKWSELSVKNGGTSILDNWIKMNKKWSSQCGVYEFNEDKKDTSDRAQLRAEIEALVAHLYELNKEELSYILDTFTVLKKNEEAVFGEFQSKRKCLEEYDRLKPIIEEERKKHPEQFKISNYEEA